MKIKCERDDIMNVYGSKMIEKYTSHNLFIVLMPKKSNKECGGLCSQNKM